MILAISTSSPQASVALIAPDGTVIREDARLAPQKASQAITELLAPWKAEGLLEGITLVACDIGPGSFTGVRVGLAIAKMFAYRRGIKTIGLNSFDLISPNAIVAIPSKKGEWLVRTPGSEPFHTSEVPEEAIGYRLDTDHFPLARSFAAHVSSLEPVGAEALLPAYYAEPSISIPKKRMGMVNGAL